MINDAERRVYPVNVKTLMVVLLFVKCQIFWMTWGRAESASTAAPSPRRCGGATAQATFSATPAAFTAK